MSVAVICAATADFCFELYPTFCVANLLAGPVAGLIKITVGYISYTQLRERHLTFKNLVKCNSSFATKQALT